MFYEFFFFGLGLIVGSFLNVVILRYNSGRPITGRSQCFSCGKTLGATDLIPLFYFLLYGGKCRLCGSEISPQYPLVEFSTGLLFLALYLTQLPLHTTVAALFSSVLYLSILFSLLTIIVVYDMRHKIIPDLFVYAFAVFSLLTNFVDIVTFRLTTPNWADLFAGPLLFLPFYLLWLYSRGRWIGLGDGKLALGMGWLLGLSGGFSAVILAFWIGAVISVVFLLHSQLFAKGEGRIMKKYEVPFGPFLILGLLIVYFFNVDVITLVTPFAL